jgi:type I restriction-modification system DNA methylase subunit
MDDKTFLLREVLFIDTRSMGVLRGHTYRELTDEEVQRIADTCSFLEQGNSRERKIRRYHWFM